MNKKTVAFTLGAFILTVIVLAFMTTPTNAQSNGDCEAFESSSIPNLTSTNISFTCSDVKPVYFGICDSGGVPDDDLFVIKYNNTVVTANYFQGGEEFVTIDSAQTTAGNNDASLESVNAGRVAPATFSYAISPDRNKVVNYLRDFCGDDFGGTAPPGSCPYGPRDVPVFTEDAAPANGQLQFRVLLGNENSRQSASLMQSWEIVAGQQLNNLYVHNLLNPRWARLWWQPEGSSSWYLLPSQYWFGDGTTKSEYGIECATGPQPSYHTAFAKGIPESDVCFNILEGCN